MKSDCNLLSLIDECLDKFFAEHQNNEPEAGLYNRIVDEVEKRILIKTLHFTKKNQSKAAKILGVNRNTLRKKLQSHNLNV